MVDLYRRVAQGYEQLGLTEKVLFIIVLAFATSGLAMIVVVKLPADHFTRPPTPNSWWRRHQLVRWTGLAIKNFLGILMLLPGLVMALPLIPGPGLVFILIGLSLLDFPQKRRWEIALLGRPSVLRFFNDMRARFDKPPLEIPRLPPR